MKLHSPCFDCQSRAVGCHAKCEKYAEYAKAQREATIAAYEAAKKENFAFSYNMKQIRKYRKSGSHNGPRTQHIDASIVDRTL